MSQFAFLMFVLGVVVPSLAQAKVRPLPPPSITVSELRANEQPITVEKSEETVAENAYFKRIKAHFTFTNPNTRVMSGELEFPIPDGAVVCGYALEVNGEMVPGVVCEKEKARVAFENETRKGVDPGIVEQVKGNLWRTRIFPLNPKTPRKAEVEYIAPLRDLTAAPSALLECDGEDYFLATQQAAAAQPNIRESIAHFHQGVILWDASLSAKAYAATWRKRLTALPETGNWQLSFFRNRPEHTISIQTKAELLAQIDQCIYDGGTDLTAAIHHLPPNTVTLLFSDEVDTLSLVPINYEALPGIIIASRDEAPAREVVIQKLTEAQAKETGLEATPSTLLATMWAARRMEDLASQAEARKDEFLALGRKYGVAGPGLSLIVLENLEQWLKYNIEPPKSLTLHAEWVKRRTAMDDPIAEKKAKAEHEARLLHYWEERIEWWNDPKPKKITPSSGLFAVAEGEVDTLSLPPSPVVLRGVHGSRNPSPERNAQRRRQAIQLAPRAPVDMEEAEEEYVDIDAPPLSESASYRFFGNGAPQHAAAPTTAPTATITLKAWNPDTPYLKALDANPDAAYQVYLKERETYANSPAFYLDCAGWFLKAPDTNPKQNAKTAILHEAICIELAERIMTNLAEFKLEDAALWRTMGWRLREAERYELAIRVFRKVLTLRGEEGQSYRDLALVLMEAGKRKALTSAAEAKPLLEEALQCFKTAAFDLHGRKSGRTGNDFQVAIIALEELNGLCAWIEERIWPENTRPVIPEIDAAYRRDLPVKLRIVMSWDADQTDIDIHVLEPNGEEAYYGNRRTAEGGFVSEDVTTGYGPEEYLKKELESGTYKILSNYFASHQTALTGATTVTLTIYTDWGTNAETQKVITLRLNKPKEKQVIGEVTL